MSRPTNKHIRQRIIAYRDNHNWNRDGAIRTGLCLWASQELTSPFGMTHYAPSAYQFYLQEHARGNIHQKPRVGDILLSKGSSPYGHAWVYLGRGKAMSTDIFGAGSVRIGDMRAPLTRWGQRYLGAFTPPGLRGPAPHHK